MLLQLAEVQSTNSTQISYCWLRFIDFVSIGCRVWLRFIDFVSIGCRVWLRFINSASIAWGVWLRFIDCVSIGWRALASFSGFCVRRWKSPGSCRDIPVSIAVASYPPPFSACSRTSNLSDRRVISNDRQCRRQLPRPWILIEHDVGSERIERVSRQIGSMGTRLRFARGWRIRPRRALLCSLARPLCRDLGLVLEPLPGSGLLLRDECLRRGGLEGIRQPGARLLVILGGAECRSGLRRDFLPSRAFLTAASLENAPYSSLILSDRVLSSRDFSRKSSRCSRNSAWSFSFSKSDTSLRYRD